jgi:hypothetical protein
LAITLPFNLSAIFYLYHAHETYEYLVPFVTGKTL